MEFLKKIIGDELYGQLKEKLEGNDKVKIVNALDGTYIPKSKFDDMNNDVKELKRQLGERDNQLETLKKDNKDNETLQTTIKNLQTENANQKTKYEAQIAKQQRDFTISQEISTAKAKNPKAVKALLDDTKITIGEDGEIAGLDEQIKALQKSDAYLFDIAADTGGGSNPSNANPNQGDLDKLEDEDYYKQIFNTGE